MNMHRRKPPGIYEELRTLTRLYMRKHRLTLAEMAARLGVSIRTLQYWAFDPGRVTVMNEQHINELVRLLRLDGMMSLRLAAPVIRALGKPGRRS